MWQKFAQMFVRGQFSDSKAYFLETKEAFHDQEFVQVVANSVNHGISSYHFSIIESPKNLVDGSKKLMLNDLDINQNKEKGKNVTK